MRRKCCPKQRKAQATQRACKGVRSLQGQLSNVISCKGCELAALGSFKPPGRGEAAKGTVSLLGSPRHTSNKPALAF